MMSTETNILTRQVWSKKQTQNIDIVTIKCREEFDLTPGCGGIRRHVKEFQVKGFIECFITAVLLRKRDFLEESTWVVGGDGRFYFKEALFRIISVMAGYKVGNIVTAKEGIFTTPAMCLMVQKLGAMGGFLLTAGYLPAGPEGYFGIKYIIEDGSGAPEDILKNINDITKTIKSYQCARGLEIPLDDITSYIYGVEDRVISITVKDAVKIYAEFMKTIFDYDRIRGLLAGDEIVDIPFRIIVDCMSGASGPYACEVFEHDLGAAPGTVINKEPKELFDAGYPSPRNSKGLVQRLRSGTQEAGFAMDTDGDRVMVMGRGAYHVYSGDSVAIVAEHLHCIPYFQINGINGYARSYSTSKAIDSVAKKNNKPVYELPSAWIYFSNLVKTKKISFYGDYNYGLGSSHLCEKDSIWGVLAWLSVLRHMRMSVQCLLQHHWLQYGRIFTSTVVYEELDKDDLTEFVEYIEFLTSHEQFTASQYAQPPGLYTVLDSKTFKYTDPLIKITRRFGIMITIHPNAKVTYRAVFGKKNLLRIYLEAYSNEPTDFVSEPTAYLHSLFKLATLHVPTFFPGISPKYIL